MSKKNGRPKIDNPRNVRFELRLTQEENDELAECAKILKLTKTEVVIRGIKIIKDSIKER